MKSCTPNCNFVGDNVTIGSNVQIGYNSIIYDNVTIGDNTVIGANCSIGEPLSISYSTKDYVQPPLIIGDNCIIRSNTVLYAGASLGRGTQTGHFVTIREKNIIGEHCVIGVYCHILPGCNIGNYVRLHSYDSIAENTIISDFARLFPFVTITDEPTPPSSFWLKTIIEEFSVICANTFILPGSSLGRHCLVGAQSRISGSFDDFSFINGVPASLV